MSDTPTTDTRERILAAAERLFMTQGYDASSTRQITAEAGVNLAAVNYHFRNKDGLIQALLKRRLNAINAERLRVLDALEAAAKGKPLKPSQILDAFFGTLIRMGAGASHGGGTFLRLLGRTVTEPNDFIRALLAEEYADVVTRFREALFRALPDVPQDEIVWRFHFMLGATSYAISGTDALRVAAGWSGSDARAPDDLERLLPRLMSFLLGGLRAPLPDHRSAAAKPASRSRQPKGRSK